MTLPSAQKYMAVYELSQTFSAYSHTLMLPPVSSLASRTSLHSSAASMGASPAEVNAGSKASDRSSR